MKRIILILAFLAWGLPADAASRITAHLVVTNTPADGNTLTVNGDVRTWKTTVATPATQMLIGSGPPQSATNLFSHTLSAGFSGPISMVFAGATNVNFAGATDQAMTLSASGTWATITYSTQAVAAVYTVRVPGSAETAAVRTNNFSLLTTAISDYSTNAFAHGATALQHFVNASGVQTVSNKTFKLATFHGDITNSLGLKLTLYHRPQASIGTGGYNGLIFESALGSQNYTIAPDVSGYASLYDTALTNHPTHPAVYAPNPENLLNRFIASNSFGGLTWQNAWTHLNSFTHLTNSTIWGSTITNATIRGGTMDTNTITNPRITGNLGIGHLTVGHPASMDYGISITNGTAPSVNPTNAVATWAVSGEWQYRASAASEGAGQNNRVHNRAEDKVGSGSNYGLTGSWAMIDFGGTDIEFNTLPSAGTYLLTACLQYGSATEGDVLSFKFYDATAAADIANSQRTFNAHNTAQYCHLETIATFGSASRVQIYGLNSTAARGNVVAIESHIRYIRLY